MVWKMRPGLSQNRLPPEWWLKGNHKQANFWGRSYFLRRTQLVLACFTGIGVFHQPAGSVALFGPFCG